MGQRRTLPIALCFCFASVLGSVPGAASSQDSSKTRLRSAWDGVYTAAQAKRGQEQYDVFCTNCHGADTQGDGADVPALNDARFARKWDRRTLRELFALMSQSMPENRPGSLSQEAYGDLLSFILQNNGFPSGATDLGHDPDSLASVVFEQTPPDPR